MEAKRVIVDLLLSEYPASLAKDSNLAMNPSISPGVNVRCVMIDLLLLVASYWVSQGEF